MNGNPCDGIWIRKSTHVVIDDSWGVRHEGERYWSGAGDYDHERNLVRLRPYNNYDAAPQRWFKNIGLRPEFVRERFDFLGHGAAG